MFPVASCRWSPARRACLPCLAIELEFEQMQAALKSVAEVLSDNNRGVAENNYRRSQGY